jgi:hypothetical protein
MMDDFGDWAAYTASPPPTRSLVSRPSGGCVVEAEVGKDVGLLMKLDSRRGPG